MFKKYILVSVLALALVVGVGAYQANAALTLAALTVTSSGALTLDGAAASNIVLGGATTSGTIAIGALNTGGISIGNGATAKTISIGAGNAVNTIKIGDHATPANVITIGGANSAVTVTSSVSRATGATGSYQNIAADLTYVGGAGGTSAFHAPVMGHFHGDTLTNTQAEAYHAGLIGAYSVATSDAVTGPKAGVVGTIGVDGTASTAADAAVMAVLDGGDPGAVITANAAYGVQYLNATATAKFTYGLDLSHAAVGAYPAVTYTTADIRLSTGRSIFTGTAATRAAVRTQVGDTPAIGSIYVGSTAVGTTKPNLYVKVLGANGDTDWERIVTQASD